MFAVPLMVLPHNIGSGSGIVDELLVSLGIVLIPVLAYVLFRLGRWARRADHDEDEDEAPNE